MIFRVNLTRDVQDLYIETIKNSEISDLNKLRVIVFVD